jgi:hypothetical protein
VARRAKVGPHRKRGRPYNPNSRRNQTDRAGRRGEIDNGAPRLRARKLALTTRDDVEMTGPGILYGRGHLDNAQYSTLGHVTRLLQHVSRSMGRGASVNGLWLAIVAAGSRNATYTLPLTGDHGARRLLSRICRELDGCRSLVIEFAEERAVSPLVIRAVENRLDRHDLDMLEKLRRGLDGITVWSRGVD